MTLRSIPGGGEGDGTPPPSAAPVDPWEDTTYFHTRTREQNTTMISIRIPESTSRELQKILHSGRHPDLETYSDVVRDALWRWLRWRAEKDGDKELARRLDSQRRHGRIEALSEELAKTIATVEAAERVLEDRLSEPAARRAILTELSALAAEVQNKDLRRKIVELVARHQ